ncbi:MAG: biopolymer transporter ExbD [Verrucomicrobiae bacterium]|nr:biopolymer transporter ExbD [Verrucomicrobiae bacterium]
MKFHRQVRRLDNVLDLPSVASVFFLLVLFVMLGPLVYTPGFRVELPVAADVPGVDKPAVTVAVDAAQQLYFANRLVTEAELKSRLADAAREFGESLTLIVQADKAVKYEFLVRLTTLAREAGVRQALLATRPASVVVPRSSGRETPARPDPP